MLKDYLKDHVLLTDGAMGTYFSQLSGKDAIFSELANQSQAKLIEQIHREYIDCGAQLIRTNTFSLNCRTMGLEKPEIKTLLLHAWENAQKAVEGRNIFVGASIGPIPCCEERDTDWKGKTEEYKFLIDCFLDAGAKIFVFETFSDLEDVEEVAAYLKDLNKDAFILWQFALSADGMTRKGVSLESIVRAMESNTAVDAFGFNCGTGPTHLYSILKKYLPSPKCLSVLPNAGFPQIIHERMVYAQNAGYFGEMTAQFQSLGAKIIGGCCGTTPMHIKALGEKLFGEQKPVQKQHASTVGVTGIPGGSRRVSGTSYGCTVKSQSQGTRLPIAVELSSPQDGNAEAFIQGAKQLKEHGVDFITVPDSPLGRVRADSITLAMKAKREVGIEAIPHVCCRDRNLLGLHSALLGGYIENLRHVLAITGDPVPHAARNDVTSVFNLNSIRLIRMLQDLNTTVLAQQPFEIYAALNINVKNKEAELRRVKQKCEQGKVTFFTQPVFDDEAIDFLKHVRKETKAPVFAGMIPLVSYRNAVFLDNEMPGIHIPDGLIQRFSPGMDRDEAENAGVQLTLELIQKVQTCCDGLYLITPFHRVSMICSIVDRMAENGATCGV